MGSYGLTDSSDFYKEAILLTKACENIGKHTDFAIDRCVCLGRKPACAQANINTEKIRTSAGRVR